MELLAIVGVLALSCALGVAGTSAILGVMFSMLVPLKAAPAYSRATGTTDGTRA